MTTLREAALQALEALEEYQSKGAPFLACDGAVAALRAALAQQDEPVAWMEPPHGAIRANPNYKFTFPSQLLHWQIPLYTAPPQRQPQTIDEAMRLPRAMAQAYEAGYNAGAAAERKRIIQFLTEMQRQVGDGHNYYGVAAMRIREMV